MTGRIQCAFAALTFSVLALVLAVPAFSADTPAAAAAPSAPRTTTIVVLRNGFTLEFDHREARENVTRLFLTSAGDDYVDVATDQIQEYQPGRPMAATAPPPPPALAAPSVEQIVDAAGSKHFLDTDFLRSVIRAESDFKVKAVSPKGAQGLMQLMPGTAATLGVHNAFDPAANVDGGARYLRELLQRYHGDVAKALAAYNAGPERVDHYRGVPPYRETRAYVSRIIRDYNRKKLAERARSAAGLEKSPSASFP